MTIPPRISSGDHLQVGVLDGHDTDSASDLVPSRIKATENIEKLWVITADQ